MSNAINANESKSRNTCRCEQCGVEFIRVRGAGSLCAHCVDDNRKEELFNKLVPLKLKGRG